MVPSTVVLNPSRPQQTKMLVLRNPTDFDWIVKLVPTTDAGSVRLEKKTIALEAHKMAQIRASFNIQDLPRKGMIELSVYARPVTESNVAELQDWLSVPAASEKRVNRAFKLNCRPMEGVFSAQSIILDFPGYAIGPEQLNDVTTAPEVPLEASIRQQPTSGLKKEQELPVPDKKDADESCAVLRRFLDAIYPPRQ